MSDEVLSEAQIIQIITTIVAKHGCHVIELDLESNIINIDGPEEAQMACAQELSSFLNFYDED